MLKFHNITVSKELYKQSKGFLSFQINHLLLQLLSIG